MIILRMAAKLAILLSISRISLVAMMWRILSISNSCSMAAFSRFSFGTAWALPGAVNVSSISFRPRETRRLCFRPSSVKSGKLAWKPWNSEYVLSPSSGMSHSMDSGRCDRARDWISVVESFDRTRSVGVVRAIEKTLRCRPGRLSCLCTSLMALW